MAGDWIKIEKATVRKPEVLRVAQSLGIHPDHAFGLCFRFWSWCDDQLDSANAVGVSPALVDALVERSGFASAMLDVGWLVDVNGSLVIPNFDRHLSESAKKRALTARRVSKHATKTNAASVSNALPREEKRREEKKEKEEDFSFAENTSEGTPEGDRLTMPGGLNDWSKQFHAAYVKKVDRNEIPAALDAAIIDVVTERSIDDLRAFAFILDAAVEFTNSPIGKSPLEKLPSPARWLKAGRYWDDRKLWQTPLGETAKPRDPPRPKVSPLVGDQLMAKFGGAK